MPDLTHNRILSNLVLDSVNAGVHLTLVEIHCPRTT